MGKFNRITKNTLVVATFTFILGNIIGPILWEYCLKPRLMSPDIKIIFENKDPYVVKTRIGNDQIKEYFTLYQYRLGIKNLSNYSTIRNYTVKLTSLWNFQDGKYVTEKLFEPFRLIPNDSQREIKAGEEIYAPLARIAHIDFQKKHDAGLWSGDPAQPQFRFLMFDTPRWILSHVPPGKHKFKITIFFENRPPVEQVFSLEWSGKWFEDPKSGDVVIKQSESVGR
jgi:hypothetical protein